MAVHHAVRKDATGGPLGAVEPVDRSRRGKRWTAEIPATWTGSEAGFVLEYYVTTHDAAGSKRLSMGFAEQPLSASLTSGYARIIKPIHEQEWFWTAVVAATAAVGAGGYLLYHRARALPTEQGYLKAPP